jgi:hypothetical protein
MAIVITSLMLLLHFAGSNCVSEQDLAFLSSQKQPLTYKRVATQLGDVRPGPGPCYAYPIRGSSNTVEFWFKPPDTQKLALSVPVEIAVVAVKVQVSNRRIIWPEDLKGKDFDQVIAKIWPQN